MSTPQGEGRFGGNSNPSRPTQSVGARGSNVFTRKLGPLPVWAWMAVGLALALGYYFWKQNKKGAGTSGQSITPPGTSPDQTVAGSQIPQFVNLTEVQNTQTQNQTQSVVPPSVPQPPPPPDNDGMHHHPPDDDDRHRRRRFIEVTVGKFPTGAGGNPSASINSFGPDTAAWNSTLWGIATHYNVAGGFQELAKINDIDNPALIHVGQKIKVPVRSSANG